jgi:hypothetical protein
MTLTEFLAKFGGISVMEVVLFLTVSAMILLMVMMQMKKDKFDLRCLIADEKMKPSIHKIATVVSLVISSWAFVYQVLHSTLTEMYFVLYMTTWTGSMALNRYLEIKDKHQALPKPPDQRNDEGEPK